MAGKTPVGTDQGSDRAVESNQVHDNASAVCRNEVSNTSAGDQRHAINAMTRPGDSTATQSFDGNNPPTIVGGGGEATAATVGDTTPKVQTVNTSETRAVYGNLNRWEDPTACTFGDDLNERVHVGYAQVETTTTVETRPGDSGAGDPKPADNTGLRPDAAPGRVAEVQDGKSGDKDGDGRRDDEKGEEGKDGKGARKADGTLKDSDGAVADAKDGKKDADGDGLEDDQEDVMGAIAAGSGGKKGGRSRAVRKAEAEAQAQVGTDAELERTKLG